MKAMKCKHCGLPIHSFDFKQYAHTGGNYYYCTNARKQYQVITEKGKKRANFAQPLTKEDNIKRLLEKVKM